ncbi:Uncharacterized protein PECH_003009 [Penicillium ucsense]|uniref:Alpha and gamma adaptin binding protein p34 n=1 Tax=Penicillium ucsense TaxID=2839758 RepID=A0A8J8WE46_9EURO|nr:Uncharacterized protein PECM_002469 [Penicillium ucsense]KAF7730126.1 Uncharacterized protein PECH_003009 [Penicillium ucsense]
MAPSASTGFPAAQLNKPQGKDITNPRRLLILTPTSQSVSIIPPLLHSLTGVPVTEPPQHTPPQPETTSQPPAHTSEDTPGFADPHEHTGATTGIASSFAGYTTHAPLHLDTKYYTADIPLWVDEIPPTSDGAATAPSVPENEGSSSVPSQWRTGFLSEEAQIVRDALGALVVCVKRPEITRTITPPGSDDHPVNEPDLSRRQDVRAVLELMRDVGAVKGCIDDERGGDGDVVGVFVLVGARGSAGTSSTARSGLDPDDGGEGVVGDEIGGGDVPLSVGWWEDQLFDMGLFGWEVVEWDPAEKEGQTGEERRRNQFGEYEGMPRIKEVLETHDWSTPSPAEDLDDEGFGFDDEDDLETELLGFGQRSHTSGFGQEVHELEREMLGLRMAIERGGGDGDSDEDENGEGFVNRDDGDEELKVESIEGLMMRMQAIRDMGSDLPEAERRRFAAKAVSEIMREL